MDKLVEAVKADPAGADFTPMGTVDDMTVPDVLQTGPSLRTIVCEDTEFLVAVKAGYQDDPMFSKIIAKPHHYAMFRFENDFIYTKNRLGVECLCIPRS